MLGAVLVCQVQAVAGRGEVQARSEEGSVTLMVDGYCNRCGKPLGKVSWDAADFVWHRKCWKAHEVYTPPPWQSWTSRYGAR